MNLLQSCCIALLTAFLFVSAQGQATLGNLIVVDPTAERQLQRAMAAIGGSVGTSSFKSIVATGTITITPVVGLPRPSRVEFRVARPDKFIRIVTGRMSAEYRGFSGETLLNSVGTDDESAVERLLGLERANAARWMLGVFLVAERDAAITVASTTARLPDTISLRVTASQKFSCILDLDASTSLPVSIHYRAAVRMPPSKPVAAPSTGRGTVPQPEEVEVTMRFLDRTRVDGLSLPKRIVLEARGVVLEDIRFESFVIN